MKGQLILLRHGESLGNATRRFTRTHHAPLTPKGEAQARAAGERIRSGFRPVSVISSPYRRARQTAAIVAEMLGLGAALEIETELREQSMGDLHGQPYEAALSSPGFDRLPRWEWRPPGGETLIDVQARAVPAILGIAARHPASPVVIVSHAGTIQSVWAHSAGSWKRARGVPNAGLLIVPHDGLRLGPPTLLED
ncbi:MAG: histidine phosphatase family protein [Myxococcota bacterium]